MWEVKVSRSRLRLVPKQRLSSVSRSGILKFSSVNRNLALKLQSFCSIKDMNKTYGTFSAFDTREIMLTGMSAFRAIPDFYFALAPS